MLDFTIFSVTHILDGFCLWLMAYILTALIVAFYGVCFYPLCKLTLNADKKDERKDRKTIVLNDTPILPYLTMVVCVFLYLTAFKKADSTFLGTWVFAAVILLLAIIRFVVFGIRKKNRPLSIFKKAFCAAIILLPFVLTTIRAAESYVLR